MSDLQFLILLVFIFSRAMPTQKPFASGATFWALIGIGLFGAWVVSKI